MMNLGQTAGILSGFCLFFAVAQVPSLVLAFVEEHPPETGLFPVQGFVTSIAAALIAGALLWFAGRGAEDRFFRREGLAAVGLAWALSGGLAAIPYHWSGAMPNGFDAVFESFSGLTTTGASVLGSGGNATIEEMPRSILLWRSLTQWMGGLGIILVFIVMLPAMGVTGKNLLQSEAVGVSNEDFKPRMREQARTLGRVYLILTLLAGLSYWVLGGMPGFDAINHAFTTMATGGFSTRNASVAAFDNPLLEILVTLFMFLAGCNFLLIYGTFLPIRNPIVAWWNQRVRRQVITPRRGTQVDGLGGKRVHPLRNTEFMTYAGIAIGASILIAVLLRMDGGIIAGRDYTRMTVCLRDGFFQVVSILTSTGYATADFQAWPGVLLILLLGGMLIGGCTGSTAGGLKVLRFVVCVKLATYSVRAFLRPKSVERLKIEHETLAAKTISAILAIAILWFATILVGAVVMGLADGLGPFAAMSASASMMGCTGPAMVPVDPETLESIDPSGLNLGPFGGFGGLSDLSKIWCSLQMVLGRLEILTPLALFFPSSWRR